MRTKVIGLDFGTYQTKACVYDIDHGKSEFVKFDNDKLLFPSLISIKNDKISYGESLGNGSIDYRYFKIASARDEEFKIETENINANSNFYKYNNDYGATISPEFLATIYITYIQLFIKNSNHENKLKNGNVKNTKNLFESFFRKKNNDNKPNIIYAVCMGVPTEYYENVFNKSRRRKFKTILLISKFIQNRVNDSLIEYKNLSLSQLKSMVLSIYNTEILTINSLSSFESVLKENKIKIVAETAAGIAYLVKNGLVAKSRSEYKVLLDIGGGSSDLSFIQVSPKGDVKYFSSSSFEIASNNVFDYYKQSNESIQSLKEAEIQCLNKLNSKGRISNSINDALNKVNYLINESIFRTFINEVYTPFKKIGAVRSAQVEYNDEDLIIYGGGSNLPIINNGRVRIHSNGNYLNANETFINKRKISDFVSNLDVENDLSEFENIIDTLIVAYGLTQFSHNSRVTFFKKEDYVSPIKRIQVPHPSNENQYIYKIVEREWMEDFNN